MNKIEWGGISLSVQPRIRLNRSFDERSHSYLGYAILISGSTSDGPNDFWIGVGKGAHEKYQFRKGMVLKGKALPVQDERIETVNYYRASGISIDASDMVSESKPPPPWHGIPPALETYRERSHRRLAKIAYDTSCLTCIWGCNMPVIITVDHWKPEIQKFRTETFCYGPKSCHIYKAGPTRKVKGRNGITWEEEDWVDEEATAHRGPDDQA